MQPKYELVTFPIGELGAPSYPSLAEIVVPKSLVGGEYSVLGQLEFLEVSGREKLIAFGASGLRGRICLDTVSGAVVQVPVLRQPDRREVNASMELFGQCIETVISQFPFYGIDDDDEVTHEVSVRLRRYLAAIDPVTQSHNGFWETFIDDLDMGVYATEEVLELLP